jgi:hypothetical protein
MLKAWTMTATDRERHMANNDIILGLDPSSTCVGYGVLKLSRNFVEAGILLPEHRSAGSFERDMDLADEVGRLLERLAPSVVLVEWTKGKVGQRHGGLGAGLAVYGTGVGAVGRQVWLWARGRPNVSIEAVLENDWTRGVAKPTRQLGLAALYPEYATSLADDPGGDIADGLGLADWWLRERAATGLFSEEVRR